MGEGKPVILVVDDEPGVLSTLAMVLERAGYSVLTANKGQEAIDRVAGVAVDLALVDLHMPEMDGVAVAHEIRKRLPNCKILLLTGSLENSELIAAEADGLEFEVVTKPIPPPELLERLSALLTPV
jgi:two-component system alkaline phosphatase synthesis response regulator PhoP